MSWPADRAREIVLSDLDPAFLRALCIEMAWQYADAYRDLAADPALDDHYGLQELASRRAGGATRAMARAARIHGVPAEFRRLDCNGQRKLLLKAGRVVLIHEAFTALGEAPRAAEYKRQLADLHGFVRQLELDLGDQPHRIRDWSGCVLAVLLHGSAGSRFTKEHCALGGLMLGVPDAAYRNWVLRLDLHQIAMFGREEPEKHKEEAPMQTDKVFVPLKVKREHGTR